MNQRRPHVYEIKNRNQIRVAMRADGDSPIGKYSF